jgi:hypothetical protein
MAVPPSDEFDSMNMSSGRILGGSFTSFRNPTETQGDEDERNFEVVFHNKALKKILNNFGGLDDFIAKPVFNTEEIQVPLSLSVAASSKYSDQILGLIYQYK